MLVLLGPGHQHFVHIRVRGSERSRDDEAGPAIPYKEGSDLGPQLALSQCEMNQHAREFVGFVQPATTLQGVQDHCGQFDWLRCLLGVLTPEVEGSATSVMLEEYRKQTEYLLADLANRRLFV